MDRNTHRADTIDFASIINDIWHSAKRLWILMILTIGISAALFYVLAKRNYTPSYRARATVIVNTPDTVSNPGSSVASQVAATFPYIIKNDALRQIIAEDLKLSEIPGTIQAERVGETNMIEIIVVSDDSQNAYNILLSVLSNYSEIARAVVGETELEVMEMSGVPKAATNRLNTRKSALIGAVFAFVVWIVLLSIYASLKKTIRSEEEFRRVLSLPCLGNIPRVGRHTRKKKKKQKRELLITDDKVPYGFSEGIRTIRTRIERDHIESGAVVYLISSALAGEGKSTIAKNLALSLVGKGFQTILVDMDLRKHTLSPGEGITDIIAGKLTVEQALRTDEKSGLTILPAGQAKENIIHLINDRKLAEIFTYLRENAEFVIVDTPPSSQVSDAAALVQYADKGIYVIRQDYTPLEYIKEGIGILEDTGLSIAGCVLNQTERGIVDYAYGYSKGYYGHYEKYAPRKVNAQKEEETADAVRGETSQ